MQTSLLSVETRGTARKKMRLEQGKFLVGQDRLSDLPVFLIDDVVSRLPCRSASFMSILSKRWEYLMNFFPGLLFDEREFVYRNDKVNDRRLCQLMDPLNASKLQHYLDVFKGARVLKLSNLFTECVFTAESKFAVHCLYHLSEMKVTANLRRSSYKKYLLEVLSMSHCRTSLSLNFEQDPFALFGDALASLDLKFHDQHQGVIILQGENNDCIKDHLYEISVQIRKGDSQIISLLKFLLGKAFHLKKFVVQFSVDVSANNRSSMISKITAQKMASKACEMVIC